MGRVDDIEQRLEGGAGAEGVTEDEEDGVVGALESAGDSGLAGGELQCFAPGEMNGDGCNCRVLHVGHTTHVGHACHVTLTDTPVYGIIGADTGICNGGTGEGRARPT